MNIYDFQSEERFNTPFYLLIFITVSYLFSFLIRMIWVYQFQDNPSFIWNDQLMINTNDGYYFASAVQYVLENMHQSNPQIPPALSSYPGMIYITAYATKFLPFSFESVILYIPAVISSLVVIPIILIARLFKMPLFGFFSALLGSIAWSYYNRTMVGYYDSDMFSVLMQMMVLYSFISLLVQHRINNIIMAFIIIAAYPYFYPQGLSLIYAMYGLYILYALYYYRDEQITYISIATIALSLMPIDLSFKIILLLALIFIYQSKKLSLKHLMLLSGGIFLFFLFNANVFGLIYGKIIGYTSRGTEDNGLAFFQVIQTVREAGDIPFEVMANRIIGSSVGVVAALIGYILLVIKHKQFIIALPLIAIGVFSLWGGLRFTVYAVAIAAMSAIFLFYVLTRLIVNDKIRYTAIALLTALIIYPNITHIIGYKVPTVFSKQEVQSLDKLRKMGSDKDYIIAWWDYGYPLWFYTNKNTLIDGAKHHHDNYIVSRILNTSSQLEAAQLSRLAVETYIKSGYKNIADTLFKNHQPDQVDVDKYLQNLARNRVDLPKKSAEVFLYLPYRMLNILPTVTIFSNIDLKTGKQKQRPFFYSTQRYMDKDGVINLDNGIILDKAKGAVQIGNQKVPLSSFITTAIRADGTTQVKKQIVSMRGQLTLIYMSSYNRFLLVDNFYLNSLYIKMFVLDSYDHNLFESVESTPHVKIYRLKV